jgi:hypothetical protein
MGYCNPMNKQTEANIGWVIGALTVLTAVAAYLWLTTPPEALLDATYSVM